MVHFPSFLSVGSETQFTHRGYNDVSLAETEYWDFDLNCVLPEILATRREGESTNLISPIKDPGEAEGER